MKIEKYVGSIRDAVGFIKKKVPGVQCKVGLILGSGLSEAVPHLEGMRIIPFTQIPHFPRTTVAGHEGKLVLGGLNGLPIAVMQGRFHYYEGHSMETIALPIRVMEYLGLKRLIITSAVGSLRARIKPGHFVVLKDHINFMGRNPLRAFHEEEFGEMFPDLTDAYDPRMRRLVMGICRKRRVPAHEGVYVATGGPSYETPAEIRAFARLGADVVGMSVVPEVIVARQMGVRTMVLTWVANMASGLPGASLIHSEVLALGKSVSGPLKGVLHDLLKLAPASLCDS
ncbi:MAG: purine-nucleoside phosphorylase [Elusimicrobia bacterium]|nr:purine-nucleoside phosphorylase [Elusimicrobiota bacterium]